MHVCYKVWKYASYLVKIFYAPLKTMPNVKSI